MLFPFIPFFIGINLFAGNTVLPNSDRTESESNQTEIVSQKRILNEKILLFDGSELTGNLIRLDKRKNLFWQNESVADPISFNYRSISSINFDRSVTPLKQIPHDRKSLRLYFKNGDKLSCEFEQLTKEHLIIKSKFSERLSIPTSDIQKLEFLPISHQTLYDPSLGLQNWKKSNSKSWIIEDTDFVSVFSGSIGTTLPKKDAIEIEFEAQWERSFYLAMRIFSDSDGSTYGNEGYHLSFSNNRLNLQVNKRKKGRIVRETIGTLMLDDMMKEKKAHVHVLAHRQNKEFIIFINEKQVAHWKDSIEDFQPTGNGILLINQGGNSYIRLKQLNVSGWDGSFFPAQKKDIISQKKVEYVVMNNGDSTPVSSIIGKDDLFSIETKRGTFDLPRKRIRNINFPEISNQHSTEPQPEHILLNQSLGQLSFKLQSISESTLVGLHPSFGKFILPLKRIKYMKCNLHLLRLRKYLIALNSAKKALDEQQPEIALSILEQLDPPLRSWYWKRLTFIAKSMKAEEILSFSPHKDQTLTSATFAGNGETILSTGIDGTYSLWNGHAKLASGTFSESHKSVLEPGRLANEEQSMVSITSTYWLSETEVTQEQFESITSNNPSPEKNATLPIICTWFEAVQFCETLNKKEKPPSGYIWRLPTESEWERACRGDSTGPYCYTETGSIQTDESSYRKHLSKYGWFAENSSGKVHPVKQKLPNSLGLYDMHGNVWEWCLDATETNKSLFLQNRTPGRSNPYTSVGDWRVLRGGCYDVDYSRCRSAYRGANAPSIVQQDRGFRIALGRDFNQELNSTAKKLTDNIIKLEKHRLTFLPVPPKDFIMGSPSLLTSPKAITRSFGDELITGSIDGIFGITDFSGEPVKKIADLNSSISSLCASNNNQWIIIGCVNGTVHVFDGITLRRKKTLQDHSFSVTGLAISNNNESFCTSGLDGKIHCYSLPTFAKNWAVHAIDHNTSFDNLEYNPQGTKLLSSGSGATPKLFSVQTGRKIKMNNFPYREIQKSRFLHDGESFASITKNGMLIFTETTRGLVYKIVRLNLNKVSDFSFSPHGKRIIVSTEEGSCSIRKSPNNNTLCIKSEKDGLRYSPDYFFALANKTEPFSKNLSDFLAYNDFKKTSGTKQRGYQTSPDGKLVITTIDGALRLWDLETGIWIATLGDKFVSPFNNCAFSSDGNFILARLKSNQFLIYPTDPLPYSKSDLPEEFNDLESCF